MRGVREVLGTVLHAQHRQVKLDGVYDLSGCCILASIWEGESRPPLPHGWQSCRVNELFLTQCISIHNSTLLEPGLCLPQ